jgi:hypothetical protein
VSHWDSKCRIREVMRSLPSFKRALLLWPLCWSILHSDEIVAVEIHQAVLQKGIYTFDSADVDGECAAERKGCPDIAEQFKNSPLWGTYFAAVCAEENKNRCVCEADITYPALAPDKGSEAVNEAFKRIADRYACSAGIAITTLQYEEPFSVAHISSVKFKGYERATGGQGSCHSQALAITANSETGHVYTLEEALNKGQDVAIRNSIVTYVTTYILEPPSNENVGRRAAALRILQSGLSQNLWTLGFYLRDRQLFVDLNEYIFGCVGGPSFAVPIPQQYIVNREIVNVLRPF